jgi:RNA polymerase sigma-70 factor (ECF subfamily)
MSETVIVAALKRGNLRRAVELILDTYQDEVYGYCASLVGAAHSAPVYQQVLAVAMEELPTFNGRVSIRAWLYGIARRVVLSYQSRAAADEVKVPIFPESRDDLPGLRPTDVELETCFAERLPREVREILQLALWHGLLLSEVAHITNRSPAAVRRLAAQGLSRLSGELQRFSGTPS